ncbi:hypothetical protein G1H11_16855 [Phytoactinopolyspora alkaliphila]|uniref:Uncharacterized protein n=1 Tax=Phytoactinopolyspora alkaliphila TaxID=1783498 RepID=A0A6N9YQ60_9ACTN|nr:hypothetical protein [Phytoactinopolyspora alkaliphila]NED96978.1 hypothetical protein [Phytoactinopolyspora alkaliphila]
MIAIATAMLGIVLLAAAVLALVGVAHELTRSPRGRRWVRRRRYAMRVRADAFADLAVLGLRAGRRLVAQQLSRPVPAPARRPVIAVKQQLASR